MKHTGRGWEPTTKMQEVLQDTYTTKANIGEALQVSQPTLVLLLDKENKLTFQQLRTISNDSGISLLELIKLLC